MDLLIALWVFNNVLVSIMSLLRAQGIYVVGYPDDLLLANIQQMVQALQSYGWILNLKKSSMDHLTDSNTWV